MRQLLALLGLTRQELKDCQHLVLKRTAELIWRRTRETRRQAQKAIVQYINSL